MIRKAISLATRPSSRKRASAEAKLKKSASMGDETNDFTKLMRELGFTKPLQKGVKHTDSNLKPLTHILASINDMGKTPDSTGEILTKEKTLQKLTDMETHLCDLPAPLLMGLGKGQVDGKNTAVQVVNDLLSAVRGKKKTLTQGETRLNKSSAYKQKHEEFVKKPTTKGGFEKTSPTSDLSPEKLAEFVDADTVMEADFNSDPANHVYGDLDVVATEPEDGNQTYEEPVTVGGSEYAEPVAIVDQTYELAASKSISNGEVVDDALAPTPPPRTTAQATIFDKTDMIPAGSDSGKPTAVQGEINAHPFTPLSNESFIEEDSEVEIDKPAPPPRESRVVNGVTVTDVDLAALIASL